MKSIIARRESSLASCGIGIGIGWEYTIGSQIRRDDYDQIDMTYIHYEMRKMKKVEEIEVHSIL